ncbi:TlpA family protein disulfide reductase [Insolitispirillum peregrinum]|uniref:TlpA family protein disulfide reductase n=1 Tax=Insolitispirillum peregrinum TaxID=80876 RepID=UPI00361F622F
MDADLDAEGHNRPTLAHRHQAGITPQRWGKGMLAIVTIVAAVASLMGGEVHAQTPEQTCSLATTPLLPTTINRLIETKPPCQMPDLAFSDGDNRPLKLSSFRGKAVLLNLWATWCPPCVKEMPSLDRLQGKLGGEHFAVVAISQDKGGAGVVVPWLASNRLTHLAAYLDPQSTISQTLQTPGLPVSMVLDAEGREVARLFGKTEWDAPEMIARLQALISASPK